MPYGHIRQYENLVRDAEKKRIQITRQQQQKIAKLYRDISQDMGHELSKKNSYTLTYRWVKDYAKSLKEQSKEMFNGLQNIVSTSILDIANTETGVQQDFWGNINPRLSERFRDVFSTIPQSCVDELMNGGVYKDFTGLSERLWNYQGKFNRDIGYVINRGIIEQKSAYELAKDLELYLRPESKKPWEWRKVYPGCNQQVDYNAQRLARTAVTHAYQLSFKRSTIDNPFIEQYQWHSSNGGRTCEICRQRDGQLFDKDKVPLDHPNGMCIITAVINKSYDEIAEELKTWANGGENPALDKWLGKSIAKAVENSIIKSRGSIQKMDLQFFSEKDIKNQDSGSLKRAIRKYQMHIDEHKKKVSDPALIYPDWDTYDIRYQEGLKRHWNKEIRNFEQSIKDRTEELRKRGDYNE